MLADKAEGRIISLYFHIKLTPPDVPLGDTDGADLIGIGLIKEAMLLLKTAGEKEGFSVQITATNIVY